MELHICSLKEGKKKNKITQKKKKKKKKKKNKEEEEEKNPILGTELSSKQQLSSRFKWKNHRDNKRTPISLR